MTEFGPLARIFVRYIVGAFAGGAVVDSIIADADLMNVITILVAAVVGVLIERLYLIAKERGWAT